MAKPKPDGPKDQNPNSPPGSGDARIDPDPPISSSDAQIPPDYASTATDFVTPEQTTSKSTTVSETPAETAEPSTPQPQSGGGGLPSGAASKATNVAPPTTQSAPAEVNNDVLAANVGDQPSQKDSLGFTPYVEA